MSIISNVLIYSVLQLQLTVNSHGSIHMHACSYIHMYKLDTRPIPHQRLDFQILPNLDLAECIYMSSAVRGLSLVHNTTQCFAQRGTTCG